jgi:hypothetical protein
MAPDIFSATRRRTTTGLKIMRLILTELSAPASGAQTARIAGNTWPSPRRGAIAPTLTLHIVSDVW